MKMPLFRFLRLYCGISLNELAREASLSPQRISQIELVQCRAGKKVVEAFIALVIKRRYKLQEVERMLSLYSGDLFKEIEVGDLIDE